MSNKEMEELKKELSKTDYKDLTEEQKKLYKELWCREMIMSCLIYNESLDSHYITKYYQTLGEKRTKELCKEQKEYFDNHCRVDKNVGTDNEGVTYNSITEY